MVLITEEQNGQLHVHEIQINEDFSDIRVPCIIKTHVPVAAFLCTKFPWVEGDVYKRINFSKPGLHAGCQVQLNVESIKEFCKANA